MQTPNTSAASEAIEPAPRGFHEVMASLTGWWRKDVMGTVDQVAVIEKRRAECSLSARYLLMISMSAGIAVLGLLQGSAAVVIGAMLLSPLMDPIMGVGFALAVGDYKWLRQSARSLAIGTGFAVLFCALLVFLSPLQTITSEIAARTRPSLLDLGVAFFSSVAGAYAMIRGREGTIVGVAIATALMPPLAVVGFGLATLNATIFWGALFLFITNLMVIALTATGMARLYGFSTSLSDKHTRMQTFLIFSAFVVLAIPLFLSLRQIVWESQATRQFNTVIVDTFDGQATVSQLTTNYESSPIRVSANVFTPQIIVDAEARAEATLTRRLGREIEVTLTQVRVGAGSQAQEMAQLSAAREEEAEARARANDIAERLAMLAGVPAEDVTVDRERRRALVSARPLDGASLAAYRELERRIAATEPSWDIRFAPPLRPLPEIVFDGEELTAEGRRALVLATWAQDRVGVPVRLEGPEASIAALRAILAEDDNSMLAEVSGTGYGPVTASWATGE
ncbi:MAG: TIGR00341 family protein [Erythrobacter sp.]|nr:MAG: TIGR00341 family protein [Erythrobacter sp.]